MSYFLPRLATALLFFTACHHVAANPRPTPAITARAVASPDSAAAAEDVPASLDSIYSAEDAAYASLQSKINAPVPASVSAELAAEFNRWTASIVAAAAETDMVPLPVADSNSADGITCVSKNSDHGENFNPQDCPDAIATACRKLSHSATGAYFWDQWVWSYNGDCSFGYWMPQSLINASSNSVPSVYECTNDVLGVMNAQCGQKNGGKSAASVNVAELPDGKGSTGQQVDSGKISYLMAANPWRCDHGCSD